MQAATAVYNKKQHTSLKMYLIFSLWRCFNFKIVTLIFRRGSSQIDVATLPLLFKQMIKTSVLLQSRTNKNLSALMLHRFNGTQKGNHMTILLGAHKTGSKSRGCCYQVERAN